jgi:ABC-type spermidine/putrescine transport system permease subunit II
VLAFLFLPILVVVVFSVNAGDSLARFEGVSTRWYAEAFSDQGIAASFGQSLLIGSLSAVVSTVLGTALAIGLHRASPALRAAGNGAVVIRLISPETATAVALFLMFGLLDVTLSLTTVLLGHIALSLAFVTVVVRSRLAAIGTDVEDAAMDLGATPGTAVWLTVMPLLVPSIVVGGMLAFILSFDNFVTSFFTTGIGTQPLPLWIYSSLRFGVSPVVNALGVLMLLISLATAVVAVLALRATRKR